MSPASKKSSGETTTCAWCSATVPVEAATCPSCGASLRDAADGDIPGVTQVDPAAVVRTKRIRTRNVAAFLGVILYNLGAGLYYMLVDKGTSKRTVNALTRRIGFSIALIALVIVGIATGVVQPHGVGA